MKIELIKLKFNDTHSYKYKPFHYCCEEIDGNECIELTKEDMVTSSFIKEDDGIDGCYLPKLCISHTETITSYEDEWEITNNYPIRFCPYCGEKIYIKVVKEIDVSDKYNELTKQREELWKKCQRTDSKREESKLKEQVRDLDDQINDFYELGEWKGEY